MTTVQGLFTAGDGVGACAHKFSSGSHAEGRIAAKSAIRFIRDHPEPSTIDPAKVRSIKEEVYQPLNTYEEFKGFSSDPIINPNYILPKMFLFRLNKIMDEYVGGTSTWYTTNEQMLKRGQELLQFLREDSAKLAATNLHDLLRCWENVHRLWTAEVHLRHVLHRTETRYPGYLYRSDYPDIDEENWKVFVNSRWDPETGEWTMSKKPVISIV
jgi:adenylylsulfate reductase subunit A